MIPSNPGVVRKLVVAGAVLLVACGSVDLTPVDPLNATYSIEQRSVTLRGGMFEEPAAPGSAAKTKTQLLDPRAAGDLNADRRPDAAVILTRSGGGSGTFYYLAVLLGAGAGTSVPTNAVLLGDRIRVDAVRIDNGRITVETLDRRTGEPFSAAPSVTVVRTFQVVDGRLAETK